ncbi:MAG: hypothetical protein M0004_12560 [Actinomycetota bacterium]|nr:hypothetical protein [Actinomycetota bacterium]
MAAVLLAVAALLPGTPATSTFAVGWTAENDYFASTLAAGTLGAPSIDSLAASGSSMKLAWADGTNGNAYDIAVSAPSTSNNNCSSSTGFEPVTTLTATAVSFTDASSAVPVVSSGEWLCYQVLTGYGATPVGIATTIASGATVGAIDLSSVPVAISSGDTITLTNPSGQSQSFTASTAAAASSTAEEVSVGSGTTAQYGFPSGTTTAYDATSWTSWTSPGSYDAAQVGLVATGVVIANGGTVGQIDKGDTVTITFNQAPNVSSLLTQTTACTLTGTANEIILGDETVGTGTCNSNDVAAFGTLKSSVALTNSLAYPVSYSVNGSVVTITFGASGTSGTATTIAASPTWTYVPPASGFSSLASPATAVCTAASLCQPSTTTNF